MGVDGLAVGDREALGAQGFEAHFIGAAGDRAFDPGRQQTLEGLEQDVLHGNGERQHPVEEGRDGRKLVLEPAVTVEQRQAGGRFELPERTAIDLAAHQQLVKLAQGIAGIVDFQIVAGAEHVLAAGLPLAAVIAPRLSSLRAIVEMKRFCAFTSVDTGRNSGGCFWLVRLVRPKPWMAVSAFQPASSR